MPSSSVRKYFFLALFFGAILFAGRILWPFATLIILSATLSVVLYPIYGWLKKKVRFSWLAALIAVLFFLIIVCIPLFFIGSVVLEQSKSLYAWVIENGGFNNIVSVLNDSITKAVPAAGAVDIKAGLANTIERITSSIGSVFSATLSSVFSFLLVVLSMFYFFKDGAEWKRMILHTSPLSDESNKKILEKLRIAASGIVKGYLLIALVQGVLMGLGLYLFGVPHPALWGVFAAIASLIPTIGTALVSVPAILFLFMMGDDGNAIGMAIWAGVLVGSVDNVLNPLFVGRKIAIHPLLVLFSVLGGLALMGPIGILIGPLAISLVYALSSVYASEMIA